MEFVNACELGREPVNSVSANLLASVLHDLVTKYHQSRRSKQKLSYAQVRCTDHLEIRRKLTKFGEDEGFESDEDAQSTSSSCCLVDDHVFKRDGVDRCSPSGTCMSTDSANSSASSDTDDQETPSPIGRSIFESFPIGDVIFCHTEPRHPNTIAWVVKKKTNYFDTTSRLGKTGVENIENCLDVIVIKCKNSEDFKKLCNGYREKSRRIKLDHYRSISRRKPIVLSTITDTKDIKVSLSDIQVTKSSLLKASELSILNPKIISSFKSELKNSVSLNSLLKTEETLSKPAVKQDSMKKSSSLSNISPNKFNLLQRTDLDGMTHIEVSKTLNKSKIQKEIEGVILTDVEGSTRRDQVRQRQSPSVLSEVILPASPPQRPERRKYTRKKQPAPKPPLQSSTPLPLISECKSKSKFYLPIQEEPHKNNNQFMRQQAWTENEGWNHRERNPKKNNESCDRRRARSVGRKIPMAYRYIDISDPPPPLQENTRRRRNSFDDVIQQTSNLKSVMKTKKNKYHEPKKVTFSAFATVQVVD